MEVVILSAGASTRLGQDGKRHLPKKPLLNLWGETVVERQVRLLRRAGVKNIKVVAGDNEDAIRGLLGDKVEYMRTVYNHKNALYELAHVCLVTDEVDTLLCILGDTVFSLKMVYEMLKPNSQGIVVYGSTRVEDYPKSWWNRGDEVFAVKLSYPYIQLGFRLFGLMEDKHYELKNIPKQLNIPVIPLLECVDIDQQQDYDYVLNHIHEWGKE